MRANVTPKLVRDPMATVLAMASGRSADLKELRPGVYEIGHWNPEFMIQEKIAMFSFDDETFQQLIGDRSEIGVCDDPEQAEELFKDLFDHPDYSFVMFVVRIDRADQPLEGGWRWHKWGEYIGTKEPKCEYLHDEPDIERVWTFQIYRIQE